jgi:hypothetical protein
MLFTFGAALLALNLIPDPAQAQARVFVAAQGSDSNPCTFAAPCRTFQHAHDIAADGGEIDVLDPAGYGPLTINKPISIQGHGFAGIGVASGGTGIFVTSSTANVHLRGLLVDGAGVGGTGINVSSCALLMIEDSVIRNVTGTGILVSLLGGATTLVVSNVLVASNNNGISVVAGLTASIDAELDNVVVADNASVAIDAKNEGSGTMTLVVARSLVTKNATGISSFANGGSKAAVAFVRDTTVSKNTTGISTGQNSVLRIGRSTITNNGTGITIPATAILGIVHSYGDNYLDANTTNGAPTDTIALK